jgi:hypothetical protein
MSKSEALPFTFINSLFSRARTRELPGNYPFAVKQGFISEFSRKWHTPAETLFSDTRNILINYVKAIIKDHFATYGRGDLHQRVLSATSLTTNGSLLTFVIICRLVVTDHIKKCCDRTLERIEWLVRLEERPFSLNEHYLGDYKGEYLSG